MVVPLFGPTPVRSQNRPAETNPVDYATAHLSKIAEAVAIEAPIKLDGVLDEAAWQLATPVGDFVQWEPRPGALASEPTEVRFLYDADNLYVGAICYDSHAEKMVVTELKEDFGGNDSDGFGFFLDTMNDKRSGFFIATNPAGAKRDTQAANDGELTNRDWDGVWDVRTTIQKDRWIAEFVVPFKTLRFSRAESQEWGLNMVRRVRRMNEDAHWAPLPRRYRIHRASLAGTLRGLEGIRQGRNFKLKPYVISSITDRRVSGQATREFDGDAGFDLKYGLTPQVTLDATVRTDFSQVESDTQQVNLTRFSLFFPEKREFFLENSGTFDFGSTVPISLDRGERDNLIPFFSRRIGLSSDGRPIPILGGARVTGKIGSYDIGTIAMRTGAEGSTPANTFLVGRLKKNLFDNSWIGAIFTGRESGRANDSNAMYGFDARFRFFRNLELSSYALETDTPGRGGKGRATQVQAGWITNELSLLGVYQSVGDRFNPEVGYLRRGGIRNPSATVSWRPRTRRFQQIRNFEVYGKLDYFADSDGVIATREQTARFAIVLQSGGQISGTAQRTFDRLRAPFRIRTGISIAPGDYLYDEGNLEFNTNPSRKVSVSGRFNAGEFFNGRTQGFGTGLNLKPTYRFNLEITHSRNRVRLPVGNFTTDLIGSRFLYAFSTRMYLNAFIQYNSDTRDVSSNVRFNIIHHPLSDLFVVYNERRHSVTHALIDRAVILKMTQLFNF